MNHDHFLKMAIDLARENVEKGWGGPFGAIVVRNNEIIGRGQNRVTTQCDPTAHAEVQAIREACKNLGTFQLEDCIIYTSCEPCPMCIGAIYWARPKEVYFACTKEDAARIQFDDAFIYDEISRPLPQRNMPMIKLTIENEREPFELWEASTGKIEY